MHKEEQRGFRKAWTRCGRTDPSAWGRSRAAIDDATRQQSASAAESRCTSPKPDVWRDGWRRTWGRRTSIAVHAATLQRVQHRAANWLHADGGDPRMAARTGAVRAYKHDEHAISVDANLPWNTCAEPSQSTTSHFGDVVHLLHAPALETLLSFHPCRGGRRVPTIGRGVWPRVRCPCRQ